MHNHVTSDHIVANPFSPAFIYIFIVLPEHLERAVLAERAKVASQVHKLDELRQLLHDKTLTVDSLRRQLESSGSGGGSNAHNSQYNANAYSQKGNKDAHNQSQQRAHMSVTDQRAVDFLRRNGNYAGEWMSVTMFELVCGCSNSLSETISFPSIVCTCDHNFHLPHANSHFHIEFTHAHL